MPVTFDPDAGMPLRLPHCLYPAGTRAAGQRAGGADRKAIEESVGIAYEIFSRVFRRMPERIEKQYASARK